MNCYLLVSLFRCGAKISYHTQGVVQKTRQKVVLTPHFLLKNIFAFSSCDFLFTQLTNKAVLLPKQHISFLFAISYSFPYFPLTFTYTVFSENNLDYLSTTSEFVVVVVESRDHSGGPPYLVKLNIDMFFLTKLVLAFPP